MPNESVSVDFSQLLTPVLRSGPSLSPDWSSNINVLTVAPGTGTNADDGVHRAGEEGTFAAPRIKILPYCGGTPGSTFSMRVIAWHQYGTNELNLVWIPVPLVELNCVCCQQPGPFPTFYPTRRLIAEYENFCDTISIATDSVTGLPLGSLGPRGEIVSVGQGMPAFVIVELRGCQRFQVDFKRGDPVSMNALWARA